jgi:hypothetical protein
MKFITLSVLLLAIHYTCDAQYKDMEVYYPENSLYKKLHVAKVIDVINTPRLVHEYDRKGRETAWYYLGDSVQTKFVYTYAGDTLVRTQQCVTNGVSEVYRKESYLYDKKRRIIYYADNYADFYNPEQDQTLESYYDSISYSDKSFVCTRKFANSSKEVFHYEKTGDGKTDLRKRFNNDGKLVAIDSIFYDAKKRKIREVTLTIEGDAGHFKITNLLWVDKYTYKPGRVIIMTRKGTKREVMEDQFASITEMNILGNGLISKIYIGDTSKTVLSTQYEYSFWK